MPGQTVIFGPFEFEMVSGGLKKDGVTIPLADREGRVLALLLECPGQLVTRETFETEVWRNTSVQFPNALNTAIRRLREALGDEYAGHLKTKRNEGYLFDAVVTPKAPEIEVAPASSGLTRDRRGTTTWLVASSAVIGVSLFMVWLLNYSRKPRLSVIGVTQITNDGRAKSPYNASYGEHVYLGEMVDRDLRLYRIAAAGGTATQASTSFAGQWPDPLDSYEDKGELLVRDASGLVSWSPLTDRIRRISNRSCDFARWSPDHGKIACAVGGGLYLLDADGADQRLIKQMSMIQLVTWTSDGAKIRYSGKTNVEEKLGLREYSIKEGSDRPVERPGSNEAIAGLYVNNFWLYVSGRDNNIYAQRIGSEPVALTNGPVRFYSLGANHNGNVLYSVGQTKRGELLRFDVRANAWRPYLNGLSADCLAWSPDGNYVVYVTYPQQELWTSRVNGLEARQLTTAPIQVYHPNWSPDGKRLAYEARGEAGIWRIYSIGHDGGSPEEIAPGVQPKLQEREPVWSPDGHTIVFTTRADASPPEQLALYSADLATHQIRRLPGTDELSSPRWAPDQTGLLALTPRNEIVFYDLRTASVRVLTAGHKAWPHWSTNGLRICFLEGVRQSLGCVEREGGPVEDLTPVPFAITGNTFSTEWGSNFWAGFTPDGSLVLLKDVGHAELYALSLRWH